MKTESEIVKDHLEFFQAVDRIKVAGFIALDTKRDQLFYKALNELNIILSDSIKLIVSNQNKYNKLFNAEWILSSEYNLDYSEIFSTDDPKAFEVDSRRKIQQDNLISRKSVKYGFYSLVSAISSLRNECLKYQRIDLARTLNEGIIELLTKISEEEFDTYEHVRYQNELRLIIDDMVYQDYDDNNEKNIFLKNQGIFFWYMSCVYNSGFDIHRLLGIFDDQFFLSIKRAIISDQKKVLESLAGRLIDGIHFNRANIEYNFIQRREWGKKDRRKALDDVLQSELSKLKDVYLKKEYNDKYKALDSIWTELNQTIIKDQRDELENLKNLVSKSLNDSFLFNHIRINLSHYLAFALFKKKYSIVNIFLEYNQPLGNVSSYMNKDILPTSLNEMKELGIRRYSIENRFFYLWDNHRDNEPFLNNFMVILLARIFHFNRNGFILENIDFKNEEEKPSFQGFIEKLNQSRFESILNPELYSVFNEDFINDFRIAMDNLKRAIDKDLKEAWLEKPVSQEKINEFKSDVRESLYSYPSLWNIYNSFGRVSDEIRDNVEYKYSGINQMDPKGYFVAGSGGIYVEWPRSYARLISDNLEGFIGSEIGMISERRKCPKYQLLEKLEKEDLSNKIIISRNFRVSFETFRETEQFEAIDYNESSNDSNTGLAGNYKGADVYEIFTRSSQLESILILDKDDMGLILQAKPDQKWMSVDQIEGFEFFDVHGFAGNHELIEEIMREDIPWMRELDDEEKRNRLLDSVSIRFYKKLAFELPKITPIIYNF